ncbi:hypothetical protein QP794_18280 [Paenibacillus sp. UMB7766-LJ446]|uniref:hypothetical protein n=1 Tax=Paenibacillus sp. UMB7766-LJ446 TaxID=3046313 RepID=UPI00254FBDF6|nr:hypothetical protein [Paenibacillus sp. UMB7766-LJ446]MDK8192040.1 hypothetical protein [Paenibacillus sp. UMB7766-LJ446]
MVAFVLEIHENLLQTVVPVRYMDIELEFAGNNDVDIFVGGVSPTRGELYRYLFRIGADTGNYIIHNLEVSSDPCELRIISNSSSPSHLVIRIYCRSDQGQTLGILSEHQMIKMAD